MAITVDMKWREPYVSGGFNSKLKDVLPKGRYFGFEIEPGTGLSVTVTGAPQRGSLAVAVYGEYGLMVRQPVLDVDTLAVSTGTSYVVIDAVYQVEAATTAELKVVNGAGLEDWHLILATLVIPGGSTSISTSHITPVVAAEVVRADVGADPDFSASDLMAYDPSNGVMKVVSISDLQAGMVAGHEAAADPHSQYINQTRLNAALNENSTASRARSFFMGQI